MSKKIMEYMQTPEFDAIVQRKIEEDRQAGADWRRSLVNQANDKCHEKGLAIDDQQLEMQKRFVADDLEYEEIVKMIRLLSELAGVPLPEPTPHDMGLD